MTPLSRTGNRPALLLDPDYYGTLAAVRCLGRAGVAVTVAGPGGFAFSFWSRFTRRRLQAPSVNDPEALLDWLLRFGEREPGHVLNATSDDVAWHLAQHQEQLAAHFHLFTPGAETLRRLLDKAELHRLCAEVGLLTPPTCFPKSEDDVNAVAAGEPFPLLIKPRSQVLLATHQKGMIVSEAASLSAAYKAFRDAHVTHRSLEKTMPGSSWPMLQQVYPEAKSGIYSLAGFVSRDGATWALASRKVLQRPRTLGIGLCFEEAEVKEDLLSGVRALCLAAGYFGAFEAEFIETAAGPLLIDFNPRYYSQMEFEVQRGLPIPLLAYDAASGTSSRTSPAISNPECKRVYLHGMLFAVVIEGQSITGRMSPPEVAGWRAWRRQNKACATDAILDRDDMRPALLDALRILWQLLRHPRSFVRQNWLDR